MPPSPCICVVDAFVSGSLYAPAARERGLRSIHVNNGGTVPPRYARGFRPEDHALEIAFTGDLEACVRDVAAQRPLCVIPGVERGVNLADLLSERLGVPTNGVALSACRRDKYAMQRRIQDAGLRGIPTLLASDWREAEAWIRRGEHLPVVMKPPASAATDHVRTCRDLATAEAAFAEISAAANVYDEPNGGVIVQPFIPADEYIVNTASCGGHHAVGSVWRVEKQRGTYTLYDCITLQDYAVVKQQGIIDYAFAVLDALGIRYGAAHTELFWTAETGPCLIETGARLGGQKGAQLAEAANSVSNVKASLDSYLNSDRFFDRYARPYHLHRHAARVELIAPRSGTLAGLPRLNEVRALPSFREIDMTVAIGKPIKQTTDFVSVPGFVDLIHQDPAVVAADRAKIRALEANGFFDIA